MKMITLAHPDAPGETRQVPAGSKLAKRLIARNWAEPEYVTLAHPVNRSRTRAVIEGSSLEANLRRGGWSEMTAEELAEAIASSGAEPIEGPHVDEALEELKGEALDEALANAGLPTTGRAAEKRERLARHLASQTTEPEQGAGRTDHVG